jgi:CDP-diacylglycerol--glycerol-3-phosphate 3-phosphatidyltransferase
VTRGGGGPADRWSRLHHGIDPSGVPLLLPWLRVMWSVARPLRRVPPTLITAAGAGLAVTAVLLAADHPAPAVALVLAAALCDALDGAVAVVGDHASRSGAVADAVADRMSDVAFAAVLWRCGVPVAVAAACAVVALAVDGLRRWRRTPRRITVAERPSWTVCSALGAGTSAIAGSGEWPVLVCAGVWLGLGVAGLAQLAVTPRAAAAPSKSAGRGDGHAPTPP